jgi:AraC family transcriptional regulator
VQRYVQRLRLERAATQVVNNRSRPITTIALDCGFSSPSVFARAFKEAFGHPASAIRNQPELLRGKTGTIKSKESKTNRKTGKAEITIEDYFDPRTGTMTWRIKMKESSFGAEVSVKNREETTVAYVRHTGPYKGNGDLFAGLINKIMRWAAPRNLFIPGKTQLMSIYHDNPEITEEDKLRISMGITVDPDTEVSGEVGKMKLDAGKYAVARFELSENEYEQAWNSFYGSWLPESGYQPDDGPAMEVYLNDPKEHPEGQCSVEMWLPVKPL